MIPRHKLPKRLRWAVRGRWYLFLGTVFTIVTLVSLYFGWDRSDVIERPSRRLLQHNPPDLFTKQQLKSGAVVLYLVGIIYTFLAIAIVADEFFVPAIEVIVEKLHMSPDTAGATFMAAGGSAPELFTSLLGTFVTQSQVGFGTIVGSAVFNVLFVIGCCAIFTDGDLVLTWWPFARDSSYYCFSLLLLAIFFGVATPDKIYWYEALILFMLYFTYVYMMMNNERLHLWFMKRFVYGEEETKRKMSAAVVPQIDENGHVQEVPAFEAQPSFADMPRAQLPIEFHVSLFDFLTRDEDITELAGIHMVARIKGNVEETFRAIDENGDGYIDRRELRAVLFRLGEAVSEADVQACFDAIDTNHDGKITSEEFFPWYHRSKMRMHTDIKRVFTRFDRNEDNHIDLDELEALLRAINHETPTDEDIQRAEEELDPQKTGRISLENFISWYERSMYFEKKKQALAADFDAEQKDEEEGLNLSFPQGTSARINYLITMPIILLLYISLWDVRIKNNERFFVWTFLASIGWLGFYSWLMVWWADVFGRVVGIPAEVMGLTLLAAGTSVPDLLTSVIVARHGEADMAVSSSIGSNIFDILVGLPFPWLLYCIVNRATFIPVVQGTLFWSIFVLFGMLLCVLAAIKFQGWRMTHTLGYIMFGLYFVFLAQDLLRAYAHLL